jgi:RHS repeat-associated protein
VGSPICYVYDGLNPVASTLCGSTQGLIDYLLGVGLDELYLTSNAGVNESFLRDALNSTLAVTSASGAILDQVTYDPYGNNSDSNGSYAPVFKFTGREYEGAGFAYTTLYNLRGRYYDAALGRFISRDPAGLAGGINHYAYAGDDPVDFSDPTGDCWGWCGGGGDSNWGPNWPTPNPTGGGGGGGSGVVGAFVYQPQMMANANGLERAVVQAYHGQNGGGVTSPNILLLVQYLRSPNAGGDHNGDGGTPKDLEDEYDLMKNASRLGGVAGTLSGVGAALWWGSEPFWWGVAGGFGGAVLGATAAYLNFKARVDARNRAPQVLAQPSPMP